MVFALAVAAAAQALGAEAILLDIERGTLPNDAEGCSVSLSEEHAAAKDAISLKAIFPEKSSGWAGQSPARKKDWTGYTRLCFHIHSTLDKTTTMSFVVKDAASGSRNEWAVLHFELKPGSSDYALDISDLKAQSGRKLDIAAVRQWHFSYRFFPEADWETKEEGPLTLYLSSLRLMADQPAAAPQPAPGPGARITGAIGNKPVDLVLTSAALDPAAIAPALAAAPAAAAPPRKRPKMPEITRPVMFDTPEADRIIEALQIFPPDNPWNEDISRRPVHPNSKNIIASCNAERWVWFNLDMGYIIVPPSHKRVDVKITAYPGESDKGPFPIPDNAPIEGWPIHGGSLEDYQRKKENSDRHALVVDPVNRMLYEFYAARKTDAGWEAAQASVFDLKSNKLRPDGWTSSDAAGLPVFPAAIRYEECERGMVEHAMRVTFRRTRREYVYPATHLASRHTDPNFPRMGERLRLRKDFDTSGFSKHPRAILEGLKRYGMYCADNGMDWLISIAPDRRLKNLEELKRVKGKDFEVIVPTGPNEGPRAK